MEEEGRLAPPAAQQSRMKRTSEGQVRRGWRRVDQGRCDIGR